MATPTFSTGTNFAKVLSDTNHYSQSVRIGPLVKLSGQGGWDAEGTFSSEPKTQVEQAFKNIEELLKEAGASWKDVVAGRSYHIDLAGTLEVATGFLKEFTVEGRRPIWTGVGVTSLAVPDMIIEIEVEAYIQAKA